MTTRTTNRLPGLDGLRAVSIAGVILYHLACQHHWKGWMLAVANRGEFGVGVFFVLSGFLITWLLLGEEASAGRINLRIFYFRRVLRICPPAYTYLLVIAVLSFVAVLPISPRSLIPAAALYCNYSTRDEGFSGHFWTLAVEEQFYLIWPILLVVLPARLRLWVTIVLVMAAPVWRTIFFLRSGPTVDTVRRFELIYDGLLMGGLLAQVHETPRGKQFLHHRWLQNAWVIPICVLLVLALLMPPALLRYPTGVDRRFWARNEGAELLHLPQSRR